MKKASLAVLVSLSALATSAAFAQEDQGIKMTHDPQVAAEIEQHAQEAQSAQQEAMPATQMEHHTPHHRKPMKHEKQE
ncbi:MAG TPA: hypothetical protein VL689_22230 [Paraburkholderia sp.]|jgi:uncharacterized MAPEG superfamily protein|nr:hypothetical protein [Paraburkholderia sp.]